MKILVISDLHNDQPILRKLDILLGKEKFDLAIIPGDINNPHPNNIDYVEALDNIFIKHDLRWLAVHGNNDPSEVINYLNKKDLNLHYKPQDIGGYHLEGIGGWGYDLPPYKLTLDQKTILVTHIPPRNHDSNPPKIQNTPLIHLAGHLHHLQKYYDLTNTLVINIPSAKSTNHYAILNLPNKTPTFHTLPGISYL